MKNALLALAFALSIPVSAAENRAPVSGYCTDTEGKVAIRVFRVADQLMAAWAYVDQKVAAFQHTLELSYSVSRETFFSMTFSSDATREPKEMELYFEVGPFGRGTVSSTFFKNPSNRRPTRISCTFQY